MVDAKNPLRYNDASERVLAVVSKVAGRLEAFDLNTVDGEFYWRCCRTDFDDDMASLRPRYAAAERACIETLWRTDKLVRSEQFGIHVPIHSGTAQADAIAKRYGLPYVEILSRVRDANHPIPMRPPDPYFVIDDERPFGSAKAVVLRVSSPGWTGRYVAKFLEDFVNGSLIDDSLKRRREDSEVWLSIDLDLEPEQGPPCIVVSVALPLPPTDGIAVLYDAVLSGDRRWRERLMGATNNQSVEVALRTWTVGLLVASGWKTAKAMQDVCERAGLAEVAQARFLQDSQLLTQRVPEARHYLSAPRSHPKRAA